MISATSPFVIAAASFSFFGATGFFGLVLVVSRASTARVARLPALRCRLSATSANVARDGLPRSAFSSGPVRGERI